MLRPSSNFALSLLVFIATFAAFRSTAAFTYAPGSEPLAVKSPFLNTWISGTAPIAGSWPFNPINGGITGWAGHARIDGVGYNFMGDP